MEDKPDAGRALAGSFEPPSKNDWLHDPPRRDPCHRMDWLSHLSLTPPPWLAPLLLAPVIGSFMGVLIQRLPDGRPVAIARSVCDRCAHPLGVRDLVPLLSYLLAKGRCRYCREPIGPFVLAIELAAAAVPVWAALAGVADVWFACVLGWTLLTLAWIDARTMILPDVLTLPLLIAGLAATWLTDPEALTNHLIAAVCGYLSLAAVAWSYRRLRGRDGLGLGDANLLAALGAWLGLGLLPLTLFIAACLGLLATGGAVLAGKRMTGGTAIPFGPFLAMAGWLLWLYADALEKWMPF